MLSRRSHLFSISAILFVCIVSLGSAQWTADVTVNSDSLEISETLTFGTDTNVSSVEGPGFPPSPGAVDYLYVGFKYCFDDRPIERYYTIYIDSDGPWLLRIKTNVEFTLEWNGLEAIDDGVYHVSRALYGVDNPREDWGLLRNQSFVNLSAGDYFIRIAKIRESTRTASLVSGQSIAFQTDDCSTGIAIELVSGTEDEATVTRLDTSPVGMSGTNVLPVNWAMDTDAADISTKLCFYYSDEKVKEIGLTEDTIVLGYNDGFGWCISPTQRDTEKNKLWTTTDLFSSTWAIGEESSLNDELTAYDASLILQHIIGLITLSANQQNEKDVDRDEILTVNDVKLILKKVVSLIDEF